MAEYTNAEKAERNAKSWDEFLLILWIRIICRKPILSLQALRVLEKAPCSMRCLEWTWQKREKAVRLQST